MPKISVITPVYNGEKYLRETAESLFNQTFEDWEWVIVNDGSKDHTADILKEFEVDPRVRVFHQSNGGEARARNNGLDHVLGEYIGFLDADDLYTPNALSDLSQYLDLHADIGVVFSDGFVCDADGKDISRLTEHRPGIHEGMVLEALVIDASVLTVPVCTLTRRVWVEEHQIRFDPNLVIGPDWDFWIRLSVHTPFGYLDKITCKYRVHDNNITRLSGRQKRRLDLLYGREKVLNSDFFGKLSLSTRKRFFYFLLMRLIYDLPEQQEKMILHPQFVAMPNPIKGTLLRQMAASAIRNNLPLPWVRECLSRAMDSDPSLKTRSLKWVLALGYAPARLIVNIWQSGIALREKIVSIRNPRPKRVSSRLGPVGK